MITELVVLQPINLCNLNCSYCYLPGRQNKKKMPDHILEKSMQVIFNSNFTKPSEKKKFLKILWHAGEPLLAGIDFYEQAIEYLAKYNINKVPVEMHIQTNATPITQTWCDYFIKRNIQVAVSLDGPEFLHNKYRKNWHGHGSHKLVMKGVECLKKNNLPLRAICVLTKDSLDHPIEMYEFFKMHGFESINFNVEEQEGIHELSTLNIANADSLKINIIDKYTHFMSTFYDLWNNDGRPFHIREFDRLFKVLKWNKMFGTKIFLPSIETAGFGIITISKDGNISTFSPELANGTLDDPGKFNLNNIMNINSFDELIDNPNFQSQLSAIKKGVEMCSKECEYFSVCGGGSASNKFYENGRFDSTSTSTCTLSYKVLTDIIINKLKPSTAAA